MSITFSTFGVSTTVIFITTDNFISSLFSVFCSFIKGEFRDNFFCVTVSGK